MIELIKINKPLFIPLFLSLIFFLRKGIQYVLIDSCIPLFFVVVLLCLILVSANYNKKGFLLILRIWAIVVIAWSIVRIFISIINGITNTFDEYHLANQFGIFGIILSLFALTIGIMIYKYSNEKRMKGWQ